MTTTTYYDLNIVEGSDIVNPLIVDNPNYAKIDEVMHDNAVAGVTLATEIANATVHAITRENSDCAVIRFIATSRWKAGDTATVDGVPVTALLPSGETLPDGAYVINANVLCILTGTNLTVYVGGKNVENASEIPYNNTNVGAELTKLNGNIETLNENLNVRYNSETDMVQIYFGGQWVNWKAGNLVTYDNLCLLENVSITASSQFNEQHTASNLLVDNTETWISSTSTADFTITLPNICTINNLFLSSLYSSGYTYHDCTITVQVSTNGVTFESIGTYTLPALTDKTIDLNNIQAKAVKVIYNSYNITDQSFGNLVMCRYVKLMGRSMV